MIFFCFDLPLRWKNGILGPSCQLCALDLGKGSSGLQQVQYSKSVLLIYHHSRYKVWQAILGCFFSNLYTFRHND